MRYPTFKRTHPKYFQEGIPLVEDAHVIYVNLDGFARYYLDEFYRRYGAINTHLGRLLDKGVFFNALRNTMPSITNPCQNMILSGSTSAVTKNVYRYYDRTQNIVIQQKRENKAILISEAAVSKGLSVTSVAHYLTEKDLTNNQVNKLYVRADNSIKEVVDRGPAKFGDNFSRFNQLYKIIKKEPVTVEGKMFVFEELPQLIVFYADDLDGVGHNEVPTYGYPLAVSEDLRIENIMKLLKEIDDGIGKLIEVAKEAKVYDQMTFFLTTDHGMVPFGMKDENDLIHKESKINDLFNAIKTFVPNAKIEFLSPDEKAKDDTNIVCVGANLNVQLTFRDDISLESLKTLKRDLLKLPFVGAVMEKSEFADAGYLASACDLIISPKGRYFFSKNLTKSYLARGQHDSLIDQAARVPGWIFGKGIKKGITIEEVSYNYDFGTTIAAALGLILPEANGLVLDVFQEVKKDSHK